ncbi:hypothetical protein PV327_004465 [Microctonus hyperodae]|uniref:Guanine nucleotide exchange factor MSS4 n=1 Tax=Microctonus hyperodae TaxID=165561 RepID=A0AA39FCH5_MICHY|nr:hypothetical protein PV327_004465 [Microctonus hyperodae]
MSAVIESDRETKCDANGKNNSRICCKFCPSVILNKGATMLVSHEFVLPHMHPKNKDDDGQVDTINDYWLVEDMYTFENISVTKTVDNIKYLACADCEIGPVGYMDLDTKKSYVAISRVLYKDKT